MIQLIKDRAQEIEKVCRKHYVKELYLFGSAAKGHLREHDSDLDFVVRFSPSLSVEFRAEHFFGQLNDLQKILGRRVDLLTYSSLKNPVMIKEVEASKEKVYAA
jgi:predicted nucleotidyltransferase